MAVARFCVSMPRAMLEELDRFAERDDRARSAVIRHALRVLFAVKAQAVEDASRRRDPTAAG